MSVMSILKAKHQPELFAQEQAEANAKHAERMAFIEGFKSLLEQHELTKAKPEFVSDKNSPSGFKPNK